MTTAELLKTEIERVHADHTVAKRLGDWTRANRFEVRARHGVVVIDLRSADIGDDVEVRLDLHRAVVKLLVADDAAIDHWDLRWTVKGKIKDGQGPSNGATRRIRVVGSATNSEIRVHRGGVAIVSALFSREYLQELHRAHKAQRASGIDDSE
jgi:hypothetical protein